MHSTTPAAEHGVLVDEQATTTQSRPHSESSVTYRTLCESPTDERKPSLYKYTFCFFFTLLFQPWHESWSISSDERNTVETS